MRPASIIAPKVSRTPSAPLSILPFGGRMRASLSYSIVSVSRSLVFNASSQAMDICSSIFGLPGGGAWLQDATMRAMPNGMIASSLFMV